MTANLPSALAEMRAEIEAMPDGRLRDALLGLLAHQVEAPSRPSLFLHGRSWLDELARERPPDPGIRLCFCPPMVDRADPEQHGVGCLEADARRAHRYWAENPPVWQPFRRPIPIGRAYCPPTIPAGCYEASFGWVHVRPGCRCARP